MITIESKKDIKLVSRAIRERWNVNKDEIIETLRSLLSNREDPELALGAAELLLKCDIVDLKREELELKHKESDDEKRLRLLELARNIPASELARIASENGIAGRGEQE